ncbi:MAG: hypothetical protein WKF41_12205 [Gaiellaceae bacterium]
MEVRRFVTVGCDLGQRRDPTAICVTEAQLRETGGKTRRVSHPDGSFTESAVTEVFFAVRFLERQALGTSYPAVAERLAGIVGRLERDLRGAQLALVMDSTGVGLPVVEMVRAALSESRCTVTGAVLTGSERMDGNVGARELRLGKLHLVSTLQALLQQGLIGLPQTAEARQLAQELLDFELRVNENANLISGAFRTGAHDDLVVALGLSCLDDPRRRQVGVSSIALWD